MIDFILIRIIIILAKNIDNIIITIIITIIKRDNFFKIDFKFLEKVLRS